jgi:putative ABC transport system substrate-binding protein
VAARGTGTTIDGAVIGLINAGISDAAVRNAAAFRKGLRETGYVEGQNVTVEYHWLEGRYDRVPAFTADLARHRVAVIATPGTPSAARRQAGETQADIARSFAVDATTIGRLQG